MKIKLVKTSESLINTKKIKDKKIVRFNWILPFLANFRHGLE